MTEIKPCPFCGSISEYVERDVEPQGDSWYGAKYETFVLCNCGACLFDGLFHSGFGGGEWGKKAAIDAWNRRADDPRVRRLWEAAKPFSEHRAVCQPDWIKMLAEFRNALAAFPEFKKEEK